MKKIQLSIIALTTMLATSCGLGTPGTTTNTTTNVLGEVLSGVINGGGANAIASIIGATTVNQQSLQRTWQYSSPGCAFTSEKLLAKAGGEVVAANIKQKLLPTYQKLGLSSSNTYVTFLQDMTFKAAFGGREFSGTYTYDESSSKVVLKSLLFNFTCYAKKNADGIGLLFDASKLLTMLQMASAVSSNSTLQTVSDLSKNYDGLRLGFDFK